MRFNDLLAPAELPRKTSLPCLIWETGMVYLTAAAKQNRILLEHIQGHALYRSFDEIEREQFDDAMIEASSAGIHDRPNLSDFTAAFSLLQPIF
ncbi:hypothetical protein AK85_08930 [Streptococcus pneumoniae B1598]|nr:hypothetical protein AK85_08930 [Streptococcus pneumoniae B1598]